MKRKLKGLLCTTLAFCMILCTAAMAADAQQTGPSVRVNGQTVDFPDGQPFIDANSRTMIPVRFVTEQLGAEVSWNGKTQTASIEKDGILVDITIGSADLQVTRDGEFSVVPMDTAAVLKDSRTYVPIRFVAEALGAFVDYSDAFRTVCIYSDVLTPDQITMLQALPYTQSDGAVGYEDGKSYYSAEQLSRFYGNCRDSFVRYANAREYLYHIPRGGQYGFEALGLNLRDYTDTNTFYANVVAEAAAEVFRDTDNIHVEFLTDSSCIYQPDDMDGTVCAVRGIVKVRTSVKANKLKADEILWLTRLGFNQLTPDVDMYLPVDVHMTTCAGYRVAVHTIVPLGEAW